MSDTEKNKRPLFEGRTMIIHDAESVTPENVISILKDVIPTHEFNMAQTAYLYRYYKGHQDILLRKKIVRPEICNIIIENRANQIVTFKSGYLVGEPIQYISRGKAAVDDEKVSNAINQLNEYMFAENKASEDKKLVDWMHICGNGYRMVLPDDTTEVDEAPFEIYTLDPRWTFVVYSNKLGNPPLMGVTYRRLSTGRIIYSIYTKDTFYEVEDTARILSQKPHSLGMIPIIEYTLNGARLGAFEVVLTLLDAINTVDSNRVDGIEQFVQAIMLLKNVRLEEGALSQIKEEGAFEYKDMDPQFKAEVKYITQELNQNETQTVVDHFYDVVLTICGMPNRNGGSSTSDTGSAVIMRDGWSDAESRARDTESCFKESEKEMLKLVLKICKDFDKLDLRLSNIEIKFTRRNYENLSEKSTVLATMLNNDKIAPKLAFLHSGMFTDPEDAYRQSMEYYESKGDNEIGREEESGSDPEGTIRKASGGVD